MEGVRKRGGCRIAKVQGNYCDWFTGLQAAKSLVHQNSLTPFKKGHTEGAPE
jgi:hypothetical protein